MHQRNCVGVFLFVSLFVGCGSTAGVEETSPPRPRHLTDLNGIRHQVPMRVDHDPEMKAANHQYVARWNDFFQRVGFKGLDEGAVHDILSGTYTARFDWHHRGGHSVYYKLSDDIFVQVDLDKKGNNTVQDIVAKQGRIPVPLTARLSFPWLFTDRYESPWSANWSEY